MVDTRKSKSKSRGTIVTPEEAGTLVQGFDSMLEDEAHVEDAPSDIDEINQNLDKQIALLELEKGALIGSAEEDLKNALGQEEPHPQQQKDKLLSDSMAAHQSYQHKKDSELYASLTKSAIISASKRQQEIDLQLKKQEKDKIAASDAMVNMMNEMLKKENYILISEENNALLEYMDAKPNRPAEGLTMFIDGFRTGIDQGRGKREQELSKLVDTMAKTNKEYRENLALLQRVISDLQAQLISHKGKDSQFPESASAVITMPHSLPAANITKPPPPRSSQVIESSQRQKRSAPDPTPPPPPKKAGKALDLQSVLDIINADKKPSEDQVASLMKLLYMGNNHLEAYGILAITKPLFVEICSRMGDTFWKNVVEKTIKASDGRKQICSILKEKMTKGSKERMEED